MEKKITSLQLQKKSRYSRLKEKLDADLFNQNWVEIDTKKVRKSHKTVDLFAGAGGLSLGLQQAGFKVIGSVEIDKDASKTINRNFPESIHFSKPIEDIKDSEIKKFGEIDLLAGGTSVVVSLLLDIETQKIQNQYYKFLVFKF